MTCLFIQNSCCWRFCTCCCGKFWCSICCYSHSILRWREKISSNDNLEKNNKNNIGDEFNHALAWTRDIFFSSIEACYYFSFSSSSRELDIHAHIHKINARSLKRQTDGCFSDYSFSLRSMMTATCLSVLHFLPRFFLLLFLSRLNNKKEKSSKETKRSKLGYLCVCCLAKQIDVRGRKKNNRCIKFWKGEKKEKKKKERIRFAYAHRNIVYLDSLERCHEADVVSLIGRWSERRKRK